MHVLVNWLWQGVAIVLLAGGVLRIARVSAAVRDAVWWITLLLVLALPALPGVLAFSGAPAPLPGASSALAAIPTPPMSAWPMTLVVAAWCGWVVYMLARLLWSLAGLAVARRRTTPFCAARESRLPHWAAARVAGRRARLAYSDRVQSAAVFGLGDPVIAVSPTAAAHLTDEELDQVLLHEWAHVQRRDDLARIVQLIVRAIAGLHPAVWWIDRRLQIEREIACDDVTIRRTGQARSFARCLTKIADLPHRDGAAAPMPAVLVRSQLSLRVSRLLDPQRDTTTQRAGGLTAVLAVTMLVAALLVSHLELVVAAMPLPERPAVPTRAPHESTQVAMPPAAPSAPIAAGDASDAGKTPEPREPRQVPGPERSSPATSAAAKAHAAVRPDAMGLAAVRTLDLAPASRAGSAWVPELPAVAMASPASGDGAAPDDAGAGGGGAHATTPWGAAAEAGVSLGRESQKAATATADAGVSVGRGSQKAATATAGFFTKLSRKIAGSF